MSIRAVFLPLFVEVTLTFVLAVWFFASGVMSLLFAWQWRSAPDMWLTAVGGALSFSPTGRAQSSAAIGGRRPTGATCSGRTCTASSAAERGVWR